MQTSSIRGTDHSVRGGVRVGFNAGFGLGSSFQELGITVKVKVRAKSR